MKASSRNLAEEEMRAEVEVLDSRLEKTRLLNKKLAASLARLEENGRSVQEAIGPIYRDTKKLQILGLNIDGVLNAIERIFQRYDIKSIEEDIIRRGPEQAGLSPYLNSVKRMNKALLELKQANIRSNNRAVADIALLLQSGHQQLEGYFRKILMEDSKTIEPLYYITKEKPFPVISLDKTTHLGLINSYMASTGKITELQGSSMSQVYASIRAPYLMQSLQNLAAATIQTLKKKSADEIYQQGSNGIATYAKGMELAFLAEYENICKLFPRDEWAKVFNNTCQGAISELMRTLREISNHIKSNLTTDCYLAYEVLEIIFSLSASIEAKTGELKPSFLGALMPVRETAKSSFGELLDYTRSSIAGLPSLPQDGSTVPITIETVTRLQTMVLYLRPVSSVMLSIGDNGWKLTRAPLSSSSSDQIPSLSTFDVGADGEQIFAHYCMDTIDILLELLEQKGKACFKVKSLLGVFIANNAAVVDRMIRNTELHPLFSSRMIDIEKWRRNGEALYTQAWREPAATLFDKSYTNRPLANTRPQSSTNPLTDSAVIVKGLSNKEKDVIKEKFRLFNASFEELVSRHKAMTMEKDVRDELVKQIQQMIEPLYGRFWDRYHEIDKGRGKYAKYDKGSVSTIFMSLL